MREQIFTILNRELTRLEALSQSQGLALDDFRTLDLLIKSYKTFVKELPFDEDNPTPQDEISALSALELLEDLDNNASSQTKI